MKALLEYGAFRALSGFFGVLPELLARRIGLGLGYLLSFASRSKLELLERHQRRIHGPDTPPKVVRRLARAMSASYGRYWAEVFWAHPRKRQAIADHIDVLDVDKVYVEQDAGRGVIFALPHLGNWEAAGAKADFIRLRVLAAAEALPNERIIDWFTKTREGLGIDVVIARPGAGVTKALVRRLNEGRVVALVADRDLKGTGVEVELFGEKTTMPAGPVALADRTGAALYPVAAYFKAGRGHTVVVGDEIQIPDLPTREERIEAGTRAFGVAVEDMVRKAPEQWHLFQPNWPSDRQ